MTSMTLFYIAMAVFAFMITVIYLSAREFLKANAEPSRSHGIGSYQAYQKII